MSRTLSYTISLAFAVGLTAGPVLAEPTTQLLADTCAICHGSFDASVERAKETEEDDDFKPEKFVEEMREIKNETGKGRIMGPIAKGLSDQQILALAEYLQQLQQ